MKQKLQFILNQFFCIDTCYPGVRGEYTSNSALGHCAIASLIIQDYLGGKIGKIKVNGISHYFNIIDNEIFDSTKTQFKDEIDYSNYEIKNREDLIKCDDTLNRYTILKNKVDKLYNEFEDINKEICKCNKCINLVEKFESNDTISFGINNILILGEAPANNGWRKSGKAFYDLNNKLLPSGKVLNELLSEIGTRIEDCFFLEAIKCYPLKRNNLNICKDNCRIFLDKQINLIKPKIILTMGDYPTKCLLKIKYSKFSDVVGKIYDYNGIIVIPIYHPSPISPLSYKGNIEIFKTTIKELLEVRK